MFTKRTPLDEEEDDDESLKENSVGSSAVIVNCSLLLGCFRHSRALRIVSESRLARRKCIDIVERFLAKDGYENVIHVFPNSQSVSELFSIQILSDLSDSAGSCVLEVHKKPDGSWC